jgi:chondroitin AC lyase
MSLATMLDKYTYLYSAYNGLGRNRTGTGRSTTDGYFTKITEAGEFTDINYDTSMNTAASRIRAMVVNYLERSGPNYLLPSAKTKIKNALDFYVAAPKNNPSNWFYKAVAGPVGILDSLLKLRAAGEYGFTDSQLEYWALNSGAEYLSDTIPGRRDSDGANTIMFLEISIRKSLFLNNLEEFKSNIVRFKDFLRFMYVTEHGLKSDYSFHHHIGLMYLAGSYGAVFTRIVSEVMYVTENTEWKFSNSEKQVMLDMMMNGMLYSQHNGTYDFAFKHKEWYKEFTITPSFYFIQNLLDVGYKVDTINTFNSYLTGSLVPNNIHNFYTSNIMVNKRNGWHQRVNYATNRQMRWSESFEPDRSVWGMYLGSTNTMITGKETLQLLPICEPNRLPGGTLRQFPLLQTPYIQETGIDINHISHGGGCDSTDYAVVIYNSDWFDVQAKKFYFMTPDGMYCMGSDLNSNEVKYNFPVATAIEQKRVDGTATIFRNGVESIVTKEVNYTDIDWGWQGNVGYILPTSQKVHCSNITITGSLTRIIPEQDENTGLQTANVFSMWINHGVGVTNQSYQYAIIPNITLTNFRKFKNPFTVLQNDSTIQAVKYGNNVYGISFQSAGFIELEAGITISVSGPSLYILEFNTLRTSLKISVSDPYGIPHMKCEISKKLSGSSFIKYSSDASTLLEFDMNSGEFMGKPIHINVNVG